MLLAACCRCRRRQSSAKTTYKRCCLMDMQHKAVLFASAYRKSAAASIVVLRWVHIDACFRQHMPPASLHCHIGHWPSSMPECSQCRAARDRYYWGGQLFALSLAPMVLDRRQKRASAAKSVCSLEQRTDRPLRVLSARLRTCQLLVCPHLLFCLSPAHPLYTSRRRASFAVPCARSILARTRRGLLSLRCTLLAVLLPM